MTETKRKLTRSKSDRMIAGVCGGLGEYFDIDPILFRLAFVLATFFGGSGVLIYIIICIVIPEEGEDPKPLDSKEYKENRTKEVKEIVSKNSDKGKIIVGGILVILGVLLLLESYLPINFNITNFWPVIIILIGVMILIRKGKE